MAAEGTPLVEQPTLRDWVAMSALTGIVANPNRENNDPYIMAEGAYFLADAMMKAREE